MNYLRDLLRSWATLVVALGGAVAVIATIVGFAQQNLEWLGLAWWIWPMAALAIASCFLHFAQFQAWKRLSTARRPGAGKSPNAYDARAIRRIQDLAHRLQGLAPSLSVSSPPGQIKDYRELDWSLHEESQRLNGRYPAVEREIDWLRRNCRPWHGKDEQITDDELREWFTVPMGRSLEALIVACNDALSRRDTSQSKGPPPSPAADS